MINLLVFLFPFLNAHAKVDICDFKKTTKDGGFQEFNIKENVLTDVESYRIIGHYLFFATSPIYGKPEIGAVNCKDGKRFSIVKPKNLVEGYPDGADFFRIKDVKKLKNGFKISYYYAENVDKQDFKKFETKNNLKSILFKE